MSRSRIVCVSLALITLWTYWPVRNCDFLNYDDPQYVTDNPPVQSGLTWAGTKWAFTAWHASNWHPLTWLSHMLDCQLYGLHAGGHHLVNAALHTANAVLLFLLLLRMTNAFWQSAVVAALFAWHPLHVESVAWIAERKDVLSTFFGLLTLWAYARHVEKIARHPGREFSGRLRTSRLWPLGFGPWPLDFGLLLFCFALGLMAKPMLVTLPFVFLLLDYWPLRRVSSFDLRDSRWRRLALEKWPFFLLSAASCVMTFLAQQRGRAIASLEGYPWDVRLANAAVSYAKYLLKSVWPSDLAVFYPRPNEMSWGPTLIALAALAIISGLVWRTRQRRPYFVIGWLWFLGMLVPVIGLVQVGYQAMADRYTYLPLVGIMIATVFGMGDWAGQRRLKPALVSTVTGLMLAGCVFGTARQLRYWHDSETLFRHAAAVTKANYVAQNSLGLALLQKGRVDEAIDWFQIVLDTQPDNMAVHNNLGTGLLQRGRVEEAVVQFEEVLRVQPKNAEALNNLAWVLATCPDPSVRNGARAVELARQADRISGGNNAGIASTLAAAYAESGLFPEAISAAQRALDLFSSQNDMAKRTAFETRLEQYQSGIPFRDDRLRKGQD